MLNETERGKVRAEANRQVVCAYSFRSLGSITLICMRFKRQVDPKAINAFALSMFSQLISLRSSHTSTFVLRFNQMSRTEFVNAFENALFGFSRVYFYARALQRAELRRKKSRKSVKRFALSHKFRFRFSLLSAVQSDDRVMRPTNRTQRSRHDTIPFSAR